MSRNESNSKSGGLVLSVKIEGTSKRIGGKRDNEAIQQQQPMNISRNINNASLDKSIIIETDTSESGKRPLQVTLDQCVSKETTAPLHSATSSRQNLLPRRGAASSEVRFHCHECRMSFVSHCFVIVSHSSLCLYASSY